MTDYMHPAVRYRLQFFDCDHLPEKLQEIVKPFNKLAYNLCDELEGPMVTNGLDKLIEAKDCFVRAAVAMENEIKSVEPFFNQES